MLLSHIGDSSTNPHGTIKSSKKTRNIPKSRAESNAQIGLRLGYTNTIAMKSNLCDDKSASLELCSNNGWDFDEAINHIHDAKEGKEVDKSSSGTLQGS